MGGIASGRLLERIMIYSLSLAESEYGDTVEEWTLSAKAKAYVEHTAGMRDLQNNEIFYAYNKRFTVRQYIPIKDTDRILYEGKFWRVLSIEHDKRRMSKIIMTELVNE